MSNEKPKTIDGLMRYLRDEKQVRISGSPQKRQLRNIGYYHGYKGCRYIYEPSNSIPYSSFSELTAVYDFDMKIKSLLYPQLMFIETAIKNYVLEILLDHSKSSSFNDIFQKSLTCYKSCNPTSKAYAEAYKMRLTLQHKIHEALTVNYSRKKKVVYHFYQSDKSVPVWAIFEIISLGEFGNLVACMDVDLKKKAAKHIGLSDEFNGDGRLLESIVFSIKDLRNSVAHNDIVFDTRFRKSEAPQAVYKLLEHETGISNIKFDTITDYVILISYLMKGLCVAKTDISRFLREYTIFIEELRTQIPLDIWNNIFRTDAKSKLLSLKAYI